MELPEELANRPPRAPGHQPTATLTLDAYRRLKEEVEDLKGRGRIDIAEKLRIAREHGDLRENADYDAAKNEQGLMEARIRHIEGMLRDPEIVERGAVSDEVGPGMLVTLRPLDDDDPEDEVYLLALSGEERAPGVRTVTTNSPLGSTIVGRKVGDEITYEAPGGAFRYRVVAFEPHA
ncbi:MAG: transcription elongation factor GreA [Actinomycetota bacterium]